MNKKISIGVGVLAAAVLISTFVSNQKPGAVALQPTPSPSLGALAGPDIPYPYITVNSLRTEFRNSPFTSGTSTGIAGKGGSIPCFFETPTATSTADSLWWSIPNTGATTTALTIVVSTTTNSVKGFATTSTTVSALTNWIATTSVPASYGKEWTWNPTKDDANIFPPSTKVLFWAATSKADASTGSIGTISGNCGGSFEVVTY